MGETYSTLVIQPIDLIRAFKVDFCLASVVKWLTKWQMDRKSEYLTRANYYIKLCDKSTATDEFLFALRMFCIVNGFMKDNSSSCLLTTIVEDISRKDYEKATCHLVSASYT